ncbi:MAG: hypothetical protein JXJ30_00785 [Halothiobacillaceae bacterium]|nr:hypothetical protein [Halothiobacillaceae bacterium]
MLAHNHPYGVAESSSADRRINERSRGPISLFNVRPLDHVVVGRPYISTAEQGLL